MPRPWPASPRPRNEGARRYQPGRRLRMHPCVVVRRRPLAHHFGTDRRPEDARDCVSALAQGPGLGGVAWRLPNARQDKVRGDFRTRRMEPVHTCSSVLRRDASARKTQNQSSSRMQNPDYGPRCCLAKAAACQLPSRECVTLCPRPQRSCLPSLQHAALMFGQDCGCLLSDETRPSRVRLLGRGSASETMEISGLRT